MVKTAEESEAMHSPISLALWWKTHQCIFEPDKRGRFYNDDITGFNFVPVSTRLDKVFEKLLGFVRGDNNPALYVGSTQTSAWLPVLTKQTHYRWIYLTL